MLPKLTDERIRRIQIRARHVATKWGYGEFADDFAQEVAIAFARGRRATVDQLFVDYLRGSFGDSRSIGGRARQLFEARQVSLDSPVNEDQGADGALLHELVGRVDDDPADGRGVVRFAESLRDKDRAVCILIFKWGLLQNEVAEVFGVTESAIALRLKHLGNRIRMFKSEETIMDQTHVEPTTGQATQPVPGIQLETRVCAAEGCGKAFRVLNSSKQVYCSNFCHPDGANIVASYTRQAVPPRKVGEYFAAKPRRTDDVYPSSALRSDRDEEPQSPTIAAVMTHEEVSKTNEEEVKVNTSGMLTAKELADELGITQVTVYKWAKNDRIPYHRESERKTLFDLAEVKRALGREKEKDEVPETPAPKSEPKKAKAPQSRADRLREKVAADEGNSLEAIKVAAMKRAMLSYRKAIFHAAEEAEGEGNHELQAGLLKEYIAAGKDIAARFAR